ncbi:biotin-dependent carboxyltransferase family protein [Thermanaerovibrio velox]|uniref:5-oxoprolinase subunit C family protein n=1 Tax=Thermanaerovibrio velox TaxID=108007 RepID=UPI003CCAE69B
MARLKLLVKAPGLLTTVQDLGRWGHQDKGVSVGGAMDPFSLRLGNVMLGNSQEASALEVTILGPSLDVLEEGGAMLFAGPDLGMMVSGEIIPPWKIVTPRKGDVISFRGPIGPGCRGYICVSGGIQVPLVMGSRSTHVRSRLGGLEGRPLKAGDIIPSGEMDPLWESGKGLVFNGPTHLDQMLGERVLEVIPGPQEHMFTPKGLETFYSSEYRVSDEADRMGYRLEGPAIEHAGGADIISDPIPLGAIQVPGNGTPIVMMADRQTSGGYTKIGVLTTWSCARLSQALPGESFRFRPVRVEEAVDRLKKFNELLRYANHLRARYRSRPYEGGCHELARHPIEPVSFKIRVQENSFLVTVTEGAREKG